MSCDNYGTGYYKISNKTEWNKLIKGLLSEINSIIDDVNDECRREKENGKTILRARDLSEYRLNHHYNLSYKSLNTYSAYSNEDIVDHIIQKKPKKLKGLTSFWNNICMVDLFFGEFVTFNNEKQTIKVYVEEGGNHNLDDFQQLRMTIKLCKLLEKVKWRQRGVKDGGYMETHCEFSGMDIEMCYGRKGKDQLKWFANRPW